MRKSVIVISSHVARGSVGNRAAVFALETLSFPVWAVPTITLPWHPGHGPSTRIVADHDEFSAFLNDLANAPWIDEVGAVLSGYMANAQQAEQVAKLVLSVRKQNPDLIYLCDPVIGDNGGLYVPQETAYSIRDNLVPIADITTPNRFELGWLAGSETADAQDQILEQVTQLSPQTVIVTSCIENGGIETGNLMKTTSGNWLVSHAALENPPNGPGDLTAAIFLGHKLASMPDESNLEDTTSSVLEILQQSASRGSNELTLETDSNSILEPKNRLQARKLS